MKIVEIGKIFCYTLPVTLWDFAIFYCMQFMAYHVYSVVCFFSPGDCKGQMDMVG